MRDSIWISFLPWGERPADHIVHRIQTRTFQASRALMRTDIHANMCTDLYIYADAACIRKYTPGPTRPLPLHARSSRSLPPFRRQNQCTVFFSFNTDMTGRRSPLWPIHMHKKRTRKSTEMAKRPGWIVVPGLAKPVLFTKCQSSSPLLAFASVPSSCSEIGIRYDDDDEHVM